VSPPNASSGARRSGSTTGRLRRRHAAINDQVRFEREWTAARLRRRRGVRLIGDVPICRGGSADHVRWPSSSATTSWPAFRPTFTSKGSQLWGNPIYDWSAVRRRRYRWWVERLRPWRSTLLTSPGSITSAASRPTGRCLAAPATPPAGAGARPGPRGVRHARRAAPPPLIAEDLGVRRGPQLRESGLPGMVSLQFGFNPHKLERPPASATRRPGALHRHARQRHAARLVAVAAFESVELVRAAGVGRGPWWG
jgi:4-alpha-glucanotransferase